MCCVQITDENHEKLKERYNYFPEVFILCIERLNNDLTAYSSYLFDDGMILPHETREVSYNV